MIVALSHSGRHIVTINLIIIIKGKVKKDSSLVLIGHSKAGLAHGIRVRSSIAL